MHALACLGREVYLQCVVSWQTRFLNSSHAKLTSNGTDPVLLPKESINVAVIHL